VLEEVRKQRQRRTIISLAVVAILIGTIGYAVYALSQSKGSGFPFQCLGFEQTTVHVHPWLQIVINTGTSNVNVTLPAAIGILDPQFDSGIALRGSCFEPMHTHDASGTIHIEAGSVSNQYTLDAFFTIWKVTYPNGVRVNGVNSPIIFNSTDILGFKIGQGHRLSLLIDKGQSTYKNSTAYGSLDLIPYDYCSAGLTTPPCYPTASGPASASGPATGDPQYPGGYPYGTGHTVEIVYS